LAINSSNDAWSAGGITVGTTAVEEGEGDGEGDGDGLFVGLFVATTVLGLTSTVGEGADGGEGGGFFHFR
jgi:hypothetical protein